MIQNGSGQEIARGLSNYSSEQIDAIKGLSSKKLADVLGFHGTSEIVSRENIAIQS